MTRTIVGKGVRIGAVVAVFATGWLCGAVSEGNAEAQLWDVGKGR